MPKIINSNNDLTNVVETLATGKDVDVYLCEKILNDMILGINVNEGGVPEKITSFNSSVTQHFALPPMITEIQLIYYHTPENVDRMHRILISKFRDIIRAFHGGDSAEIISDNSLRLLKDILSKPLNYAKEKYSNKNTPTHEDICKLFITTVRSAYKEDLEILDLHVSRTFLTDDNYNFTKEPNTIVDIALNNVASEFYGYIVKYYNLFIVNMSKYFTDSIVVDDNIKHLFITSIYNKVSLVITTNRSRKVGQTKVGSDSEGNDEYYDYIEQADFKKYIGIMPYGPFTYSVQNVADSIVASKTVYSIGRFDDIFIPRNDGVPQSQQQLSKLIDPEAISFSDFIEKCNSDKINIFRNIYQLNDFYIYSFNKLYKNTNNIPYLKSPVIGTNKFFKMTRFGSTEPSQLNFIKSIFSTSIRQLMNSYIKDKSSVDNYLIGVPFHKEDGTKTLAYHLLNNSTTYSFLNYILPDKKTIDLRKITIGKDLKVKYNTYCLYFNEYDPTKNTTIITTIDDVIQTEDSEIILFKDGKTEYKITMSLQLSEDNIVSKTIDIRYKTEEDNSEIENDKDDITTTDETSESIEKEIEIIVDETGEKPDPNIFNNIIDLYINGKLSIIETNTIKDSEIKIKFKKQEEVKDDELSDTPSSKKIFKFLGIPEDIKIQQSDLTKILSDIENIEDESLLIVIDMRNSNMQISSISIYSKE